MLNRGVAKQDNFHNIENVTLWMKSAVKIINVILLYKENFYDLLKN